MDAKISFSYKSQLFFAGHKIVQSQIISVFPMLSESLLWLSFFFKKKKNSEKMHWLDLSMTFYLQRPLQLQLKL